MLRPPKTALYHENVFRNINVNGLDNNDDFPKTCHNGMARYVLAKVAPLRQA